MTNTFDVYRDRYEKTVEGSVAFSGLSHDFFLSAKADILAEIFAAHFGVGFRPSLLDVGSGVGRLHPHLKPIVGMLAGTDPSTMSIDRAARDNPGVTYRAGDGQSVPWPAASFDAAAAICVLHHVPPGARPDFMKEMRRVVRPGGLVVLIEHNPWNVLTRLAVIRCPFDNDAVLLTARHAKKLLTACGCVDIQTRHFLLIPSRRRAARRLEMLARDWPLGAQYVAVGRA